MENANTKINIAVIDDHQLFRKGLIKLILSISDEFEVVMEASNGQDFFNRLPNEPNLDIIIVDLDMPIMNGYETAQELKQRFPDIGVLTLTMHDEDEQSIIQMLKCGVKGYLGKDIEPDELKQAIDTVASGQFHFNKVLSGKLLRIIAEDGNNNSRHNLNERELQFLEHCCTELTYKEIADKMFLSPKTIDGYRAALFERFEVKSRVGLVLLAIKNEWVKI